MDNLYIIAKTQLQYNVGTCLWHVSMQTAISPDTLPERMYRLNFSNSLTS